MNVINPEAVGAYCDALAARAAREGLGRWLRRNLRNHILREPALHRPVDPSEVERLVEDGSLTEAPPWLPAAVRRGDALALFTPDGPDALALARDVERMIDHRNAVEDEDLSRVSVPEAIVSARAWETAQSRRRVADFARRNRIDERTATALLARADGAVAALWPEAEADRTVLVRLGGGITLVDLHTEEALRRESAFMDHCVETYADSLLSGATRILSLRDPANLPLATLEVGRIHASGRMSVVARFLPRDMAVATQVRGLRNARPAPEAIAALGEAMACAGIVASEREWGWLGLPDGLRAIAHLRVDEMAAAFPSVVDAERAPSGRLTPGAAHALGILMDNLARIDDRAAAGVAAALAPSPDVESEREAGPEGLGTGTMTWTVPNLLMTGHLARLMARAGEGARPAFAALARRIVDAARAEPLAEHAVEPLLGRWRDPLPFFAWCGLAQEWTDALAASRRARRTHLDGERLRARNRLRVPGLGEAERAALLNVVNVQVPRLLAACQEPATPMRPRPAPAPARTLPAFRRPTRPAPRPRP